ncbi:redoxin domain-containing protein [Conexibacter stalactiti]|uniref:Redoxin domain-containing protein n=1 Tax=Conexibacter stalactiti TaxID=1940611 RepID=A0ABU4HLJ9_9ACTN|nr:redoxin domain-containing protein [Conexibacter stalactiti]MDW5594159.1 redoxin domain-containing protein [Conexibacter stalactiti]MEC5034801.1 redoxin domain-containing protein [Conexibacter stalactiti]
MRPPAEADILAPSFPGLARWVNVATLRMDKQLGRPVLVEFWDFCRVNSLRTIPYLQAWHERYADAGLRVVGIHASGFEASNDVDAVRAAVERLGITYPVLIDAELKAAESYGIEGWPSRYLWDKGSRLFDVHFGEGAYAETELAIQELLEIEREPVAPIRPEDEPGILLPAQSADQPGAYSGPYEAGGVWAVLSGSGTVRANGHEIAVTHPGCYPLIEHPHHTAGVLELDVPDGVRCEAVCFTPGIVPPPPLDAL